MDHRDSVVWREEARPDQQIVAEEFDPDLDTVRSRCETCDAVTVRRIRKVMPGVHKGPEQAPPPPRRLTITCDCGYAHADRPAGEQGCGRFWLVNLR
jgi:hypothetical protein